MNHSISQTATYFFNSLLERARAIAPILSELAGMSARAVAAELNARQVETPSGAPSSAKTVIRARERLASVSGGGGNP